MRSKGSRFTLGVWGLRVCSLGVAFTSATVRNRSQPFANVRNRPQYGRAYGKFSRRGRFWRFQTSRCFVSCRKSFCMAGAILLRRFQKIRCIFRGRRNAFATFSKDSLQFSSQAQTLWTCPSPFCVAGAALSTCRVACFSANRIGRAASSGDRVQIPWQAWHFVRCDENCRKPRTKYRFWSRTSRGS